jgi:diacylglycerol kinase family enzyme
MVLLSTIAVTKSGIGFRTIIIGNCSKIPGFTLLPNALYNDGLLDVAIINTRNWVFGWLKLFQSIFLQRFGIDRKKETALAQIHKTQITSFDLDLHEKALVQVDGDIIGETKGLHAEVIQGALSILIPYDESVKYGSI